MPKTYQIPKEAQREAQQGLKWRRANGRGGTAVGVGTARALAAGGTLGIEKVKHIARYFPRHEPDKKAEGFRPGEQGFPSNGRIAWALWGGDAAWTWARDIVETMSNRPVSEMDDDQRRAVMAKLHGGGGGGGRNYGSSSSASESSSTTHASGSRTNTYQQAIDAFNAKWNSTSDRSRSEYQSDRATLEATLASEGPKPLSDFSNEPVGPGKHGPDYQAYIDTWGNYTPPQPGHGSGPNGSLTAEELKKFTAWSKDAQDHRGEYTGQDGKTYLYDTRTGQILGPKMTGDQWMESIEPGVSTASGIVVDPVGEITGPMIDQASKNVSEALGVPEGTTAFVTGLLLLLVGKKLPGRLGSSGARAVEVSIAAAGGNNMVADYREHNPDMDPRADKALALTQQALAYTSVIAALTAARKGTTAAIESNTTTLDAKKRAVKGLEAAGKWIEGLGKSIGQKLPAPVQKALEKAYQIYSNVTDYTGVTVKDLQAAPSAPGRLSRGGQIIEDAEAIRTQARATFGRSAGTQADYDALDKAFRKAAAREARGAKMSEEAFRQLVKTGIVAGGFATKELYEEAKIAGTERDIRDSWAKGTEYKPDVPEPRNALETAAAFTAGTTGNALEKQFRMDSYPTREAAYRAHYDEIKEAVKRGDITATEGDRYIRQIRELKPDDKQGRALWTFAPALTSFITWKAGDLKDQMDRTTPYKVVDVLDADTVRVSRDGKTNDVRLLDFNSPEIPHPSMQALTKDPARKKIFREGEYLGQESAARLREILKPGQYVNVVKDSHPKASGKDVHGTRELGYIDKPPTGLGWAVNIPKLGALVPGQTDIGKKLLAEGYGDVRYRELSGQTDRGLEYDKTRAKAIEEKRGVFSDEGRAALKWVGKDKPFEDPSTNAPAWQALGTYAGLGLMTAGNSGLLAPMGGGGKAIAQTWNAALAGYGVADYNYKAQVAQDKAQARKNWRNPLYAPPKWKKNDFQTKYDAALERARQRNQPQSAKKD